MVHAGAAGTLPPSLSLAPDRGHTYEALNANGRALPSQDPRLIFLNSVMSLETPCPRGPARQNRPEHPAGLVAVEGKGRRLPASEVSDRRQCPALSAPLPVASVPSAAQRAPPGPLWTAVDSRVQAPRPVTLSSSPGHPCPLGVLRDAAGSRDPRLPPPLERPCGLDALGGHGRPELLASAPSAHCADFIVRRLSCA